MKSFRELRRSIKSLIWFLPVIWNDRDWDSYYFYKILERKISKISNYRKTDKYYMKYVGEHVDDKKIMIAKNLAKRLAEDAYLTNSTMSFDKRFPEAFNKKITDWAEDEHRHFRLCGKHSDYMRDQDRKYLFKILEKNVDLWWD